MHKQAAESLTLSWKWVVLLIVLQLSMGFTIASHYTELIQGFNFVRLHTALIQSTLKLTERKEKFELEKHKYPSKQTHKSGLALLSNRAWRKGWGGGKERIEDEIITRPLGKMQQNALWQRNRPLCYVSVCSSQTLSKVYQLASYEEPVCLLDWRQILLEE